MPRHGMVLCPCYSISLGYFQYWCSLAFFPSIDYIELESVTLVAVLQLKVAIVLSVRRGGGGRLSHKLPMNPKKVADKSLEKLPKSCYFFQKVAEKLLNFQKVAEKLPNFSAFRTFFGC